MPKGKTLKKTAYIGNTKRNERKVDKLKRLNLSKDYLDHSPLYGRIVPRVFCAI